MSLSFKRLTRGIKFDSNRFVADAVQLQIQPTVVPFTRKVDENVKTTTNNQAKNKPKKRKREEYEDDGDLNFFSVGSQDENSGEQSRSLSKDKKTSKPRVERGKKPVNDLLQHKMKLKLIRKMNRMHIWGEDLADPVESFEDIPNITSRILQNIQSMDYHSPTPIQMQAVPILLDGRDLLACAPTGSGKTAAFLLPLIIQLLSKPEKVGFRAVLLSPTRELAKQTYRDCLRLSKGTNLLTFMINKEDMAKHKFKNLTNCDILVSTPNRLIHLLKEKNITLDKVEYLIVDECDHLFESGFRDQLGFIYCACDSDDIKRAFFSATCAFDVEQFCKTNLNNPVILTIGAKNSAVELIKQELRFTGTESGKLMAFREIVQKGIELPMLVFVQSQERCDELFSELTKLSLPCGIIHSGKTETQRKKIVESFREGKIWILISTALLARGMDFPAVKLVVNFDLPLSHIQYIHSIGRTGRAGKLGRAITFFTEDDRDNLRKIANVLENAGFPTPPYMLKIKKGRRNKNKKELAVVDRQSLRKMSEYDYSKKKRLLQIIKQSTAKKSDQPTENKNIKIGKKLKALEKELDKQKKYLSIEKTNLQKRKTDSKKTKSKKTKSKKTDINVKLKPGKNSSSPKKNRQKSPKK